MSGKTRQTPDYIDLICSRDSCGSAFSRKHHLDRSSQISTLLPVENYERNFNQKFCSFMPTSNSFSSKSSYSQL